MNVCTLLTQLLTLNFPMLLLLLRNIMSSTRIYYCIFLNNKKSCHSKNSEEVHVQGLLGRGLLHKYHSSTNPAVQLSTLRK